MNKVSNDSEKPAHGQQVITACAFIHRRFGYAEKVFIPRRADTKKFLPGAYELPGGHIDFGEGVVGGLKREILEEFGMRIIVGDPFYVFTYTNEVKGSHSVEIIYFAVFEDPTQNIKLNPKDHSKLVWISENEIDKILTKNKKKDNPEIKAIIRGFELLRGLQINIL